MARGFSWTVLDVWGRQTLNLVVFVVLANLLLPGDFGLVALASVFVLLAQVIVDQGLGDALIQRREITKAHVDTAFWAAVGVGALLTVSGLILATPVAALFHEPRLEGVLRALSVTFLLSAMSNIQMGLLRRELAFRSLAIRTFVAVTAGGIAGIVLAFLGFGAWALVFQQIVAALVSVLTLWWVLSWRPSLHFDVSEFRELWAFGVRVVGSDLLNYVSRNADNLLIGAVLGTVPLGFYSVGYQILFTTQQLLISVVRKVTFPALSALQANQARMRRAFFRLSRTGALVIIPGYVALGIMAPELTVLVFGERWQASGVVASVLLLSGPVLSVQAFIGPILYASGHPGVYLLLQLIQTGGNVLGFAIAVPFGIVAVALAFTIRAYVLLPLSLYWMQRYAGVNARDYLRQLRGVAIATAVMGLVLAAARLVLGESQLVLLARVVLEATIGAISFFVALWISDRELLIDLRGLVQRTLPFLPFGRSALRERPDIPRDERP